MTEKWIKEGDRNTRFFHCTVSYNRHKNYIEELEVDENCFSGSPAMTEAARRYFTELYCEEFEDRQRLDNLLFPMLDNADQELLEREFTVEKIKNCSFECNGEKAPDLDGFNMKFLQQFWPVFKDELLELIKDFHRTGKFVKSLNTTFIVLIAKKEGVKNIRYFRPISLVGCIYKLFSKVLAKRMASVLDSVTGGSQHAFVEAKQILDAILTPNEVVGDLVGNKKEGIIC